MKKLDSYIQQAGLTGAQVSGRFPAFSKVAIAECVVIAVRYRDDERNRSKQYTEYEVRDLRTGQVHKSCRRISAVAGMDDGEEMVLHAAQKLHANQSGGSFTFDPLVAPLTESDGDRVLVGFVGGAHHSPVILGVVQHRRLAYGAKRSDGERRFSTHKGTSVETKADGTYVITRNVDASTKTTVTVEPNGDVKLEHSSGSKVHLINGVVQVDGQAVDGVKLGFAAAESVIKGTSMLSSVITPMITAYTTATASNTAAGSAGAPPAQIAALIAALNALNASIISALNAFSGTLSQKVKTE